VAGSDLLVLLLKQSLAVALVLLVLRALQRHSAAQRVFAARCGMAALLLIPALWPFLPTLAVPLPHAMTAALEPEASLPPLTWLASAPARADAFSAPARAADAGRVLLLVYLAGVLIHLARTVAGLARLVIIARRAQPVHAPAWADALARLRGRLGVVRPVCLLVSNEVTSPLSWGMRAPVIVLDAASAAHADPDAVIAHELAHIACGDWPAMLLGRLLLALYWWHPLMHLLVRSSENDTEHAADDTALAAGVPASDYAHTLLSVSRRAYAPAAGGMASQIAGRGNALVARIGALLDQRRARSPVHRWQWIAGAAATLVLALMLGAMVQRGEHVIWPDTLLAAPGARAGNRPETMLDAIDNPNFRQLALAMRNGDFAQRHADGGVSFRQRTAIPALVLALQDERAPVRRLAAWGLSEMRFPETAPALAALLADPAPEVRAEAAGALGDMGETRWLSALTAMLRDPDPAVRARVAHVLGDLAQPVSATALQPLLHDPDPKVTAEARWALGELR
jgi:beta-lactamase regulating signal transducer with metallopeptidase domain